MQKKGPWSVLNSEQKYSSPWFQLFEEKVVKPDGTEGIHVLGVANEGVSILPIDAENNVYLSKQYRYAIEAESLEVPGGGIDTGETPIGAAARELKEELGIVGDLTAVGLADALTETIKSRVYLFIARNLSFVEKEKGIEGNELIKMPLSEAVQKVMNSEITLGGSALLVLKANELLNGGH